MVGDGRVECEESYGIPDRSSQNQGEPALYFRNARFLTNADPVSELGGAWNTKRLCFYGLHTREIRLENPLPVVLLNIRIYVPTNGLEEKYA